MKRFTLGLGTAALLVGFAAPASADPAPLFLTNRSCSTSDLVGVTVSACSGFWDGNANGGGSQHITAQNTALAFLGATFPGTQLEHLDFDDDTDAFFVDFATTLFGKTVVSFHWGNGNSVFKTGSPNYNGNGGGSAFYMIDAGTTGIDKLYFSETMRKAISNAVLWETGDDDSGTPNENVVPEPATMTLLATGLAGMAAASRRRRKQS